jgi:hypothetical protein
MTKRLIRRTLKKIQPTARGVLVLDPLKPSGNYMSQLP